MVNFNEHVEDEGLTVMDVYIPKDAVAVLDMSDGLSHIEGVIAKLRCAACDSRDECMEKEYAILSSDIRNGGDVAGLRMSGKELEKDMPGIVGLLGQCGKPILVILLREGISITVTLKETLEALNG